MVQAVVADEAGNVYFTGTFQYTVDFDPGPATFNLTSSGGFDVFISKFDSLGNFVWAKSFGNNTDDIAFSIALDPSANVIITGEFQNTVDFDPSTSTYNITAFGSYDSYILKLNNSGNFVWVKNIGGSGWDEGKFILADNVGNLYCYGYFSATADLDPGPGNFYVTAIGGQNSYIVKLNSNGDFIWGKTLTGGFNRSYSLDLQQTNLFIVGEFQGTVDFNPDPSVTNNIIASGLTDAFILKLDTIGNYTWAHKIGGTNNDYAFSVKATTSGSVLVTGSFRGTADFDPGPYNTNTVSAGNEDAFIVKFDMNGNHLWSHGNWWNLLRYRKIHFTRYL